MTRSRKSSFPPDPSEELLYSTLFETQLSPMCRWIACSFKFDEDLANLAVTKGFDRYVRMCRRRRRAGDLAPSIDIPAYLPALRRFIKCAAIDVRRKEHTKAALEPREASRIEDASEVSSDLRIVAMHYREKLPLFLTHLLSTPQGWAYERLFTIAQTPGFESSEERVEFCSRYLFGDLRKEFLRELRWFPSKTGNAYYKAVSRLNRNLRRTWIVGRTSVF